MLVLLNDPTKSKNLHKRMSALYQHEEAVLSLRYQLVTMTSLEFFYHFKQCCGVTGACTNNVSGCGCVKMYTPFVD